MTQKQLEERIHSTEQSIGEIRRELQRLPALEKNLEKLSADLRESHRVMSQMLRDVVDRGKRESDSAVGEFMDENSQRKDVDEEEFLDNDDEGESSHTYKGGGTGRFEVKRMEMPVFDGQDPDGWFFRAEHYFQMHHLTEREKLKVSLISFEGPALNWFRWANNRQNFKNWEDLKTRLFARFRAKQGEDLCARFLAVKQNASVAEYRKVFEELSAPLPHLTEEILVNTFINGLTLAIRKEVLCLRPKGLDDMMELAQLIEDRLDSTSGDSKTIRGKEQREFSRTKEVISDRIPSRTISVTGKTVESATPRYQGQFKSLTDAELRSQ